MSSPSVDADDGALIPRLVSAERFGRYLRAVHDPVLASRLYEWNAEMGGAFGVVLGHFEVILRNALDAQMGARHRVAGRHGEWYDDADTLPDAHRRCDVANVKDRISRAGREATHGLVIAELTFGFWRLLLGPRHQTTLWAQNLRSAFPGLRPQRRDLVYTPVDELNRLRNRIAHNEPIFTAPLAIRHEQLITVTGWIDPAAATWLGGLSRVPSLLAQRPSSETR